MWKKLIYLLVAFVCSAAAFLQKRSSVLTDESKRVLDIFDFSNFDKQEALSYIDRQRFENLIRGKRSKWNLKQKLLDNELSCGGNKSIDKDEYPQGMPLKNEAELDESEENDCGPSQCVTTIHLIRRNTKQSEDGKGQEEKGSEGRMDGKETNAQVKDSHDGEHHNVKGKRKKRKKKKRHHWSKWTEWSRCSVTCGKGRRIRSRRCIAKNCDSGEIEMGEKTCQLPACSLFDKLFSFLT